MISSTLTNMSTPTKTSPDTASGTSQTAMAYPDITSMTLSELMLLCVEDTEWEHSFSSLHGPHYEAKYVFPRLRAHMDQLRLDVGNSTFECFLKRMRRFECFYRLTDAQANETEHGCQYFFPDGSMITAPLVESSFFTFSEAEFVHAGHLFEQEMYEHRCFGIVPTYEPHPAYDHFMSFIRQIAAKEIRSLWYFQVHCKCYKHVKHVAHPWNGDADAAKYYCFVRLLEALDLKTWGDDGDSLNDKGFVNYPESGSEIGSNPDFGNDQGIASGPCKRTGSFSSSICSDDLKPIPVDLGDGRSLIVAGEALDAEMLANNCTEPTPNYTPHPAYDLILSKWTLMQKFAISPLQFIADELGKEGVLQWLGLEATWSAFEHLKHIEDQEFLDSTGDSTVATSAPPSPTTTQTDAADVDNLANGLENVDLASGPVEHND